MNDQSLSAALALSCLEGYLEALNGVVQPDYVTRLNQHYISNLKAAIAAMGECNLQKHAKDTIDFMRQQGFLL